jgi:hypothetical protein
MKKLTLEDYDFLKSEDWELVSEKPLKFVRHTQFAGTHEMEGIKEVLEEIERTKAWNHQKVQEKVYEGQVRKNSLNRFKVVVKGILKEVTQETLYDFYKECLNNAYPNNYKYTEKELKDIFQVAFDEDEKENG